MKTPLKASPPSDLNINLTFDKKGDIKLKLLNDFCVEIPSFIDNPKTEAQFDEKVYCIIKEGSSSNFGSVPALFRWAVAPTDPLIAFPSIIHDALVNEFGDSRLEFFFKDGSPYIGPISWKTAADAMLELMRIRKGPWNYIKSRVVYLGIRLYGKIKNL